MKVSVTTIALKELDVDMMVVPCSEDHREKLATSLKALEDDGVNRALEDFTGKKGEAVVAYPSELNSRRLVLVGVDSDPENEFEHLRDSAARGASTCHDLKVETAAIVVPSYLDNAEMSAQALVEGFVLGSYRFDRYRTNSSSSFKGTQRLVVHSSSNDKAARKGADRGRIVAESVITARDLVNTSPDEKTPVLLAKAIERSGEKYGYTVSVWDKALIEDEKMGGLLAVNRGSMDPPTFSILEWQPDNAVNSKPVVLVGKGVVFDTGGLSLKPTKDSMDAMKSDMAGAAAVIGAMEGVARLNLPLHVVALIPATDNRPGENAYVPGDVVKMHSGKTVEVLNTDAEGRMILADALSYASTYNPELVIDLATLTGAAVVALGKFVGAVMTNRTDGFESRVADMVTAGERSGDRVHPLPLFNKYGEDIKSNVADIKNVGSRAAGSITAGKFLEHFVDYPWIHLDIAGPSFLLSADSYRSVGGTGFGVRLLLDYLRTYSNPKKK
ncbi:MAG: leucyl aminopeptidase [Rhodothermales bacterium]|nr:leucyl aminopeptidase [Rhodothermales bacterium]